MKARSRLPAGFAAIWTTIAVDLVGFGIVFPLLPLYARRFGASPATIGLLFVSFSVAQLVCAPLWGRLSDRVGRKPLIVLSLVGTAVGSLATGLAGSLPILFLARVVDGCSGASVSVAHAAVADVAPERERARLFGLLGAAFAVGFVAGPALAALSALIDHTGRLAFYVAAAIAGANALAALVRLPETNPRHEHHDVEPSAQTGLEDEVLAVEEAPRLSLPRLLTVAFTSLVAFSAFEVTLPLFGRARLHFELASTGAVFAGVGLVLALVQTSLVRPTVRRLGEAGTLRVGVAVNAAGLLILAGARSWAVLVIALLALVIGQGLASPALTASVAGAAGSRRRGRVLGLQQSTNGFARVVGPLAGTVAFERLGTSSPYLVGAALMALCLAILGPRAT